MVVSSDIPSMGGSKISPWLYDTAMGLNKGGAVVECGSWLGASIEPVAKALDDRGANIEIHCYDRWEASPSEVEKARRLADLNIQEGEDLLPLFMEYAGGIHSQLNPHKINLMEAEWELGDIHLYIDDANKTPRHFQNAMETFGPSFVPGETILLLMDFQYYQKANDPFIRKLHQCQNDFIDRNRDCFKQIKNFEGMSGVAFRYTNPIDWNNIRIFPRPIELGLAKLKGISHNVTRNFVPTDN